MKNFINFITLWTIGLQLIMAQSTLEPHTIYQKVNDAVVEVIANSKDRSNPEYTVYEEGLGSGVIISEEGLVLTAAHVIQTAEKVKIKFTSGKEVPAKIIRLAKEADVALLQLAWVPENLTIAPLADSDKVKIGERICIIGAPYGLSHSLSVGYISGRHQQVNTTSGFIRAEYFQTDASINHGNSGGPMFNSGGKVVGIVTSILTESGGFEGIGFAATSNITKKLVVDQNSLYTGLDGYLLDEAMAYLLNVPQKGGLLVQRVVPLSPADFAGLHGGNTSVSLNGENIILGGDIILSVNTIALTSPGELEEVVRSIQKTKHEKTPMVMEILRGGAIKKLKIHLNQ